MLALLIILTLSVLSWQFFLRMIYFKRLPKLSNQRNGRLLRSPVEGRVVYIKKNVLGKDVVINKEGSKHTAKIGLKLNTPYTQMGIYMSVYDNHHYADRDFGNLLSDYICGKDNPSNMMKYTDSLLSLIGVRFHDWIPKATHFMTHNQQMFLTYSSGIVVVITMDKHVNMISKVNKKGIRYFIHRGSQTDIFMPTQKPIVHTGERVTYTTYLMVKP